MGAEGGTAAGAEEGGLGWEFAEPFSAQPAAEDLGGQEGPALLGGPSLCNDVAALQGVADQGDRCREEGAIFVLEAHFDGALAAVLGQPRAAVEQGGPAGDGFAVVVAAVGRSPMGSCRRLSRTPPPRRLPW